jgi:hypothetical protein
MSITRKAIVTLAAAFITVGFSSASLAMRKSAGGNASGAEAGGSTQPSVMCVYLLGMQLCVRA